MPQKPDPRFEHPQHPGEFLYNLILDRFNDDPGGFYEAVSTVEQKEIKAGRRDSSARKTNGRDYWRGITRSVIRGDRGIGPTTGPLFAKSFRMPLTEFAAAIGLDKDSIERPPRVARRDLEAELIDLRGRVQRLEDRFTTLGPFLERAASAEQDVYLRVDRPTAEAIARQWTEQQPMSRDESQEKRRKRAG